MKTKKETKDLADTDPKRVTFNNFK